MEGYKDLRDKIKQMEEEASEEDKLAERERLNAKYAQKQQRLIDRIIDFEENYGADSDMVFLMRSFLEVSLQMRAVTQLMEAVTDSMDCLMTAIQCIDMAINFDQELIKSSMETDHGFFARRRRKKEIKKAIKNNTGRLIEVVDGIKMKYKMSQEITDAMQGVATKLRKAFGKARIKKSKTQSKNPPIESSAQVEAALAQRRAELGKTAPAPAAQGAPAPQGGKPAGTDSGIDDIVD